MGCSDIAASRLSGWVVRPGGRCGGWAGDREDGGRRPEAGGARRSDRAGEIGRGYFNLMQPKGLHGHLRHERCAGVAFVERPFMGKSSAFIAFVNADGGIMFKVFVGRDETRALRTDQLARFRQLADRVAAQGAA